MLSLPFLFLGLGRSPVVDGDESCYVLVAREMLHGGSWWFPTLDGKLFFAKSPLFLWGMAGSMKLLGASAYAARLPFALSGVGVVFLTSLLGFRLTGRVAVGLIAGAVLAVNPQFLFLHCARRAEPDVLFLLCLVASVVCLVGAMEGNRRDLYLAFFLAGLAGAAKTVAVVVFPLPLIVAGLALSGAWRKVGGKGWALAALAFLAPIVPWHLSAWIAHGQVFLDGYLFQQTLQRFSAPDVTRGEQAVRYGLTSLAAFHPFLLLAIPGILAAGSGAGERFGRASRLLLLWIVLVAVVVLPVLPGRNWYVLPAHPAIAVLIGIGSVSLLKRGGASWLAIVLVAGIGVVFRIRPDFDPFLALSEVAALRLRLAAAGWGEAVFTTGVIGLCSVVAFLLVRRPGRAPSVVLTVVLVGLVGKSGYGLSTTLQRVGPEVASERLTTLVNDLAGVDTPRAYFGRAMLRLDHRVSLESWDGTGSMEIFCDDPGGALEFLAAHPGGVLLLPALDLPLLRESGLGRDPLELLAVEKLLVGYVLDEPRRIVAVRRAAATKPTPVPLEIAVSGVSGGTVPIFVRIDEELKRVGPEGENSGARRRLRAITETLRILDDRSAVPGIQVMLQRSDVPDFLRRELVMTAAFLGDRASQDRLLQSLAEGRGRVPVDPVQALARERFGDLAGRLTERGRPLQEIVSLLYAAAGKRRVLSDGGLLLVKGSPESSQLLAVALSSQQDDRELTLTADEVNRCLSNLDLLEKSSFETVREAARVSKATFHSGAWKTW